MQNPGSKLEKKLMNQIRQYKSDPFIPEEIRAKIIDLLQNRFNVHHRITFTEYTNYRNSLAAGEHVNTLENNWGWIHNEINKQLYESGCGVSQIEEAIHEIRLDIKNYLEKFNPLNNA